MIIISDENLFSVIKDNLYNKHFVILHGPDYDYYGILLHVKSSDLSLNQKKKLKKLGKNTIFINYNSPNALVLRFDLNDIPKYLFRHI